MITQAQQAMIQAAAEHSEERVRAIALAAAQFNDWDTLEYIVHNYLEHFDSEQRAALVDLVKPELQLV